MTMKRLCAMALVLMAAACQGNANASSQALSANAGERDDDAEEKVALADVPQAVKDAAVRALPGFVLAEASREVEKGAVIYDLEGKVDGVAYEVEVSADGKVQEIEKEDDEDDQDD